MGANNTKQQPRELGGSKTLESPVDEELKKYDYPFENLVLEGGGGKAAAYPGAFQVLEKVGILQKMKRFAGASVGSIVVALVAVGYHYEEALTIMKDEMGSYLEDHSCGILSFLPNVLLDYGWNPGNKVLNWLGTMIEAKTGNKDLTFKELYLKYGKELCVVVANVNSMKGEYCHVKTTPDMPIRVAVRMSSSLPGMYAPVKWYNGHYTDMYIDGGLLINYPLHSFDGWWLSLKVEDGFLMKISKVKSLDSLCGSMERFEGFNDKTLGILLYGDDDHEVNENQIEERRVTCGGADIKWPSTTIARKRLEKKNKEEVLSKDYAQASEAMDRFFKVLSEHDLDKSSTIDKKELEQAFEKTDTFSKEDAAVLFGEDYTLDNVFELLDLNKDGQINFYELIHFSERRGINLRSRFVGYNRREISSAGDYASAIADTLMLNVKRVYTKTRDLDRTAAINVGYLETSDYFIEPEDRLYAMQQGADAVRVFLKYYVKTFNPPLRKTDDDVDDNQAAADKNEEEE
ncbi:uncharacterized protein LOC144433257 [Glandiceps talaboti]